jgi:hypothetical protein
LNLGQLGPEVCFNRGHEILRELERIASRHRGQCFFQGFGISHAGGLVRGSLGLQAGQFLIAKLDGGKLSFGFVGECLGVVVNVVDFDGGPKLIPSINEKTPLPCERWGS